MNWFKKTFGLKGSWKWACKQMTNGKVVYLTNTTGAAKYRVDPENQGRLQWAFTHDLSKAEWKNAYFFLKYMEHTTWGVYGSSRTYYDPMKGD